MSWPPSRRLLVVILSSLMEGATLTRRPALARVRALDGDAIARIAFALLCVGGVIGFLVYPTYPNYDSYYSLLWGREVLDLQLPGFEGFRVPTEHPLAIAAGALFSLFGRHGDRLFILAILASFLWLIWGVYRLGRIAFTPLVGGIAAALTLTRFDFGFLAARGYIDIPYMALVVWAAVLEAARPRRGVPVLVTLALAGMLRPEAWVLAGLYWLWLFPRATWRQRILYAALAAAGPLVWTVTDLIVTGDPLFSLLHTSSSAEDLGRQRTLGELPAAVPEFFNSIVKLPVLVAAVAGLGIALAFSPRRSAMPLAVVVTGVFTFVLIGAAGASVLERYLAVAAVGLLVFAGVALGGFTMLRRGRLRVAWTALSAALVVIGVVFTATHVRLDYFDSELTFRGAAHDDLVRVLESDPVQRGVRCGPLFTPNHKLVPDSRWILDLPESKVIPIAEPGSPKPRRGVVLVVTSRFAIFKHAWSNDIDSPLIQAPPAGWRRIVTSDFYAAYARC
jgi:hypothetical protein